MAREGVNVWNDKRLSRKSGSPAHALAFRNAKAAVRSLIGSDYQAIALFGVAIEARPVELWEGLMDLACNRRHRCHEIVLVLDEALDPQIHVLVRAAEALHTPLSRVCPSPEPESRI